MFQFVLLENFNLIFHANYPYFLDGRNGKEIDLFNSSLMFYSKISTVMHRSQRSWRSIALTHKKCKNDNQILEYGLERKKWKFKQRRYYTCKRCEFKDSVVILIGLLIWVNAPSHSVCCVMEIILMLCT